MDELRDTFRFLRFVGLSALATILVGYAILDVLAAFDITPGVWAAFALVMPLIVAVSVYLNADHPRIVAARDWICTSETRHKIVLNGFALIIYFSLTYEIGFHSLSYGLWAYMAFGAPALMLTFCALIYTNQCIDTYFFRKRRPDLYK